MVFDRFTDQARQMILTAQEEARLLQHDYVGTEHLLIAATEVDDGVPAALAALGLTTEALRSSVTRMVAPGGRDRPGELAFTAEATAALERSLREALQLGHGAIRPAHVVLGLLDVHDGTMPVLLARLGVRADVVRAAVLATFTTEPGEIVALAVAPVVPALRHARRRRPARHPADGGRPRRARRPLRDLRRRGARNVRRMKWIVHGERAIYESEWMTLALTDIEIPGGARFEHHVVRVPAAAAGTVVHDPDRGVLLLWRHRFTTDTWGWEVPAGRIDDGETPEEAAARETLEETGWRPGPLRHLTTYHPNNGTSDLRFHLFAADGRHPRRRADRPERVRARRVGARRRGAAARSPPTRCPTGCR